jgi:hypothetical protein
MLPGNIELCVPVQALEIGKVHLSPLKIMEDRNPKPGVENRPIAPLSYVDSGLTLPCLSILLPNLKITRWDPKTGRLDLDLGSHNSIHAKLTTLQDYIVSTVFIHQSSWLGQVDLDHDTVRSLLQPLVTGNTLTLFLHGPNPTLKPAGRAWIYQKDAWIRGSKPNTFTVSQEVRVCVRLHGLCLIHHHGSQIPKFRIQHQVISAIMA